VLRDEITLAGVRGFALVRSEAEPALFVSGGYRTILTFILDRADWRPRTARADEPWPRAGRRLSEPSVGVSAVR